MDDATFNKQEKSFIFLTFPQKYQKRAKKKKTNPK